MAYVCHNNSVARNAKYVACERGWLAAGGGNVAWRRTKQIFVAGVWRGHGRM